MKDFIFDEYQRCINPNRIEGGNKDFWFEIQTACKDGKWYHGHQYWTRGSHSEFDVYSDTYHCPTEREAILKELELVTKSFENEGKYIRSRLEVPPFIFKELKELEEKYKHPQMSLF